jgi:hypothetical protein
MTTPDAMLETVARFDFVLTRLLDPEPIAQSVAIDCLLTYVNRLKGQWIKQLGSAEYRRIANASDDGQTTEALVMVRNVMEHDLSKIVSPRPLGLYPGARTFLGRWTFPGENLTWLLIEDTQGAFDGHHHDLVAAYRAHLEGGIIGYSFDSARRFLAEADARVGTTGERTAEQLSRLVPPLLS